MYPAHALKDSNGGSPLASLRQKRSDSIRCLASISNRNSKKGTNSCSFAVLSKGGRPNCLKSSILAAKVSSHISQSLVLGVDVMASDLQGWLCGRENSI